MRGTKLKRCTLLLLATAALACVGSGANPQEQGGQTSQRLREIAAKAKARRQTAVTLDGFAEHMFTDDSAVLKSYSIVLVRFRKPDAATTLLNGYINTWHILQVIGELDHMPTDGMGGCEKIHLPERFI